MENSMEVSQKTKKLNYHMTQQFHTWVFIKKKKTQKNTNLKRYMYPNVHSNIIYNCQDMEAS